MGLNVPRHKDPHYWSPVQRCPSPFSAPWQRGCGLRPAQKTAHPTPRLHQVAVLLWMGQRWVWTLQGEGAGSLCPEKAPSCAPSQMTNQLQNQEWAPCPRPPQVPSLVTRECSRFILNVHVPGHPTCHPGAGSCMLGSWFLPLSPTVSPTEALRTPRLAVFTGSPPHTSSGIPSKDPPQPCSQSTRGPPDPT